METRAADHDSETTRGARHGRPRSGRRVARALCGPLMWLLFVGAVGSVGLAAADGGEAPATEGGGDAGAGWPRLVSLNPSLTQIVLRLGAGAALIGIDDYSARLHPELADRPAVGGLFDPSVEAVVALGPDLVLLVEGLDQKSHAARLERVGLEVEVFANERLDEVLANIERLGRLLGREARAAERIGAIRATRDAVARATRGRSRPTTIAVVDRSPLFLVGAETFLDEMLEAVGAENLVRSLASGYPRGSIEWLVAARPELLLDMTPGAEEAATFWARWPSLPAVRAGRVHTVEASRVTMPGPDLDLALRELAALVHGDAILAAIDAPSGSDAPPAPLTPPAPRAADARP